MIALNVKPMELDCDVDGAIKDISYERVSKHRVGWQQ